mgnify:CR=1 FL=1
MSLLKFFNLFFIWIKTVFIGFLYQLFFSLSNQADLHFGQTRISSLRGFQVCPHRLQVNFLTNILMSISIHKVLLMSRGNS